MPRAVKKLLAENNLPHLLFYGPPGTGKTSTILAIARQIYGPSMPSMTLELNASGGWGGGEGRGQGRGQGKGGGGASCI